MITHPLRRLALAAALAMPGTPAAAAPAAPHHISGFRGALFGMDEAEVRAAIARDFQAPPEAVAALENPAEQTRLIVVRVDVLEPGPVPAAITYVLGARTHRLMHVNIVWATPPHPGEPARRAIAAAAAQLAQYLRGQAWPPGKTVANVNDAGRGVLLFGAIDARNAGVELRVSGLPLPGLDAPDPAGAAQLSLSYMADVGKADIVVAKPGAAE